MATIVNNPGGSSDSSGMGIVLGVLIAIIVIVLFFVYGLPRLRGTPAPSGGNNIDVNLKLPDGGSPATSPNTNTTPAP